MIISENNVFTTQPITLLYIFASFNMVMKYYTSCNLWQCKSYLINIDSVQENTSCNFYVRFFASFYVVNVKIFILYCICILYIIHIINSVYLTYIFHKTVFHVCHKTFSCVSTKHWNALKTDCCYRDETTKQLNYSCTKRLIRTSFWQNQVWLKCSLYITEVTIKVWKK